MGNEHTVDYHPSPSKLTSRIHPLNFLWIPKRFVSPEYFWNFSGVCIYSTNHGSGKQALQRIGRGDMDPHFFWNCTLPGIFFFWKFAIVTFLAPAFPKSCWGAWKSFKFMVLKLLEETFVSWKIKSFQFFFFFFFFLL